ncbi:hypothetical protein Hanom_Chr09g00810181 [Helianthus anomalus]
MRSQLASKPSKLHSRKLKTSISSKKKKKRKLRYYRTGDEIEDENMPLREVPLR